MQAFNFLKRSIMPGRLKRESEADRTTLPIENQENVTVKPRFSKTTVRHSKRAKVYKIIPLNNEPIVTSQPGNQGNKSKAVEWFERQYVRKSNRFGRPSKRWSKRTNCKTPLPQFKPTDNRSEESINGNLKKNSRNSMRCDGTSLVRDSMRHSKKTKMAPTVAHEDAPQNAEIPKPSRPVARKSIRQTKMAKGEYPCLKNEVITSPGHIQYEMKELLGKGAFGEVILARRKGTNMMVAVKILRKDPGFVQQGIVEIEMWKRLTESNTTYLVQPYEYFPHKGHMCIIFEYLKKDMNQLMKDNHYHPFSLNMIRPVTKQLLMALSKLKEIGVIHLDLKPDNIMFVDPAKQPFQIKIIDFGSACFKENATIGSYVQSRFYRSPEIILGLPFDEAADIWSLGCVLVFMYLANHLYPALCEYMMIKYLVDTHGIPPAHLLENGTKTLLFFKYEEHTCQWILKTKDEFEADSKVTVDLRENRVFASGPLENLANVRQYAQQEQLDTIEILDRTHFVGLLKQMLTLDKDYRVSPVEALEHPFLTLGHFDYYWNYLNEADQNMAMVFHD